MNEEELEGYENKLPNRRLFLRHQKLLEKRDGHIGITNAKYAAFFFPRLNYFLGRYLRYGGVYPDGVIRLVKNGKAFFPCKDVHEQMVIDGKVGWLQNPLYHIDSPTFDRYIQRNKRYVELIANQLEEEKVGRSSTTMINFLAIKPISWFLMTQFRHKGILDGWQGIVFSFYSALRFPKAYLKFRRKAK